MDEEIKYIPYGTDEIDYNQFINNAANEVQSYVNQLPWSTKRKELFLNAYLDLISKGITGASNSSGVWKINYGLDAIPLETLSKKEQLMYGEAAYFLQLQMSKIPTKASLVKKEEDKKSKLPLFNNEYFTKLFEGHISKLFGGRDWTRSEWHDKDERDKNTGLRGTDVRKRTLAERLQTYSDSLKEGDLNFEGSPFENLNDFKTKVASAIEALNGNDEKLIKDRLNLIGLKYEDYLSNGGNDPVTLTDGTTTTYGKWAESLNALKAEEEAKAQKKAEALARANLGVLSISSGNKPIDAIYNTENYNKWLALNYGSGQQGFEKINLLIQTLLEKSYNLGKSNGLNSAERKLLGNLIHYIRTYNPKYLNNNLTPEEEEELNKHNSMKGRNLQNFVRLPWQTSDGRYTYADKSGNIYFLKPQNKRLLLQLAFTKSAEYNNYIKNFGKTKELISNEQSAKNMNTPLSLMTEWTPEMKKEIEAIAWDAASILNPEAFSGSAMALNAARLRGEANPNRSTLEKIFDYGTAGLGGIQGFGDLLVTGKLGYRLYQLGKSIGNVSKFAGILGAGFGAVGAFEARDSIAKIATDSLTPKDLENIAYGLMGLIGLKSFAKARNKQTIGKQANPTTTEYNITVKDKNNKTHEIKIDEAAAKEILLVRTLGKKKETVDSEILNMPKIKESIQKYKEANPTKKLEIEGASIVNDSKSAFGISGKNKLVTSNQVKNPNAPEYVPVGAKWYNPFGYIALGNNKWGYYLGGGWQRKAWENASPEHSPKGLWLRAKEFWNPEPKIKNETLTSKPSTETPKTKSTNTELYNKNTLYEYNILNTPNKNNSKLLLKGDSLSATLADGNTYRFVYSNEGEAIVMLNGKPVLNPVKVKNLKEAKEAFSKFVKDLNSKIENLNLSLFLKRFESKYLENIRELKRKGFFLKQGGTIDNLDTEIKEILKTL